MELLEKEKGQIFENSIKEITEQKVKLEEFQRENAILEKEALEREKELIEADKVSRYNSERALHLSHLLLSLYRPREVVPGSSFFEVSSCARTTYVRINDEKSRRIVEYHVVRVEETS